MNLHRWRNRYYCPTDQSLVYIIGRLHIYTNHNQLDNRNYITCTHLFLHILHYQLLLDQYIQSHRNPNLSTNLKIHHNLDRFPMNMSNNSIGIAIYIDSTYFKRCECCLYISHHIPRIQSIYHRHIYSNTSYQQPERIQLSISSKFLEHSQYIPPNTEIDIENIHQITGNSHRHTILLLRLCCLHICSNINLLPGSSHFYIFHISPFHK